MHDILFVAYNRLEMTREAFQALVENTIWNHVSTLYVHDDGSDDGTAEWLVRACDLLREDMNGSINVVFDGERLGGPVATTNWYLDRSYEDYVEGKVDRFAKIDNDFVVCHDWNTEILRQMTLNPEVDVFGIEPMTPGPPKMPRWRKRIVTPAQHIGGKGIIRLRIFDCCRPAAKGLQGWTQWQHAHRGVQKVWLTPDLPCFGLDQLPFEPWLSLRDAHLSEGATSRKWEPYDSSMIPYWEWWTPKHMGDV